ncbi:MAG: 2-phosphosulfolactate phosphatase [Erysipelotrichaceae bacterium]|jgi:2-phosphosulfolactate phosphatase|nr:2-phosphosulfolactate phosphatase [Erysipelotrichaceae bacterium]
MDIEILSLSSGAKQAKGTAVIIDVFRAFTLEAYLFAQGAETIYAIGSEEKARTMKKEHPAYILIGERAGKKLPGFDYGNSPSAVRTKDFSGRSFVHTTTNGTQGIKNAVHADRILTGSFVNAKATASYIRSLHPKDVSLVAMGWEDRCTEEDELCALYLKSLLEEKPLRDLKEQLNALRYSEGKKFFDPAQQEAFPQADFAMCTAADQFDFAIEAEKKDDMAVCCKRRVHA